MLIFLAPAKARQKYGSSFAVVAWRRMLEFHRRSSRNSVFKHDLGVRLNDGCGSVGYGGDVGLVRDVGEEGVLSSDHPFMSLGSHVNKVFIRIFHGNFRKFTSLWR